MTCRFSYLSGSYGKRKGTCGGGFVRRGYGMDVWQEEN